MDQLLVYGLLMAGSVVSGTLSGMSGGGGGMLTIPLMIALGLTPQQAVATGKMASLGATYGGLSAFYKSGHIRKDIVKVMIPIAIVIGLVTPFVFVKLDSELMQRIIGVLLIVLMPTLFIRRRFGERPRARNNLGYALYSGVLTLQSLFGTGVGSLALFVLTMVLGTTKLEANATRRAVMAFLAPISFLALLIAGFVNVWYGLAAVTGSFIGTHFGSRIAIRRGERFVTYAMAGVITLSGVLLLIL